MKNRKPFKRNPYPFSEVTKRDSKIRQQYQCGYCGGSLKGLVAHGHHVIPVQSGKIFCRTENHVRFMKSLDNCIMLCEDCHLSIGHDNHYSRGAVASPETFTRSHNDKKKHKKWSQRINQVWYELTGI